MEVKAKIGIGVEIAHIPLVLYYDTGSRTFEGSLDKPDDEVIYLKNTLEDLSEKKDDSPALPKGLHQLALEALSVRISKESPFLKLKARTSLVYYFSPQLKTELMLGMAYEKLEVEKVKKTHYSFKGKTLFEWWGVGSLMLDAELAHDKWHITGELKQAKSVTLQQLAETVAASFKSDTKPELPKSLQSLNLEQLKLTCIKDTGKVPATLKQTFSLDLKTSLELFKEPAEISLNIEYKGAAPEPLASGQSPKKTQQVYKQTLHIEGQINLGEHQFRLLFASSKTKSAVGVQTSSAGELVAEYNGTLSVSDLIKKLLTTNFDFELSLEQVVFVYATFTEGESTNSAWLVYAKFGETALALPPLPLIKEVVPYCRFEFKDLQISYLHAEQAVPEKLLTKLSTTLALPDTYAPLSKGFQLRGSLDLQLSEEAESAFTLFTFGTTTPDTKDISAGTATEQSTALPAKTDEVKEEKKSKSPVQFGNFKAGLKGKEFSVTFDAALKTKVLQLEFKQLSVKAPVNDLMNRKFSNIKVYVQGVSLAIDTAAVKVAGGLLRLKPDTEKNHIRHLAGFVKVDMKAFSLGIVAEYIEYKDGNFSLLAFGVARVRIPVGPVIISKIALGFGYNYAFKKVAPEALEKNPFLQMMDSDQKMDGLSNISEALVAQPGTHTIMIGAEISAFDPMKLLSARLLLIADTSSNSLHILGLASLDLNALSGGSGTIDCRILLGIVGEINEKGVFVDTSILPGSYLFLKGANLSGTGALRIWYTGQEAGDFVFTAGGYHPFYKAPKHYPANLQRTSLSVALDKDNYLKAEVYQAFTNTAVMFGARLHFHLATKRAGFSAKLEILAQLDAILSWVPFFYDLSLNARLHLKLKIGKGLFSKTLELTNQIALQIHGPDLGGLVKFEYKVLMKKIVLEIPFGKEKTAPSALSASEFKAQFLTDGHMDLRLSGPTHECNSEQQPLALFGPEAQFSLASNIPINSLKGTKGTLKKPEAPFALKPVSLSAADHQLELTLSKMDGQLLDLDHSLNVESKTGHFALGTWGTTPTPKSISEMNKQSEGNTGLEKDKDLLFRPAIDKDTASYKLISDDKTSVVQITAREKKAVVEGAEQQPAIPKKLATQTRTSRAYLNDEKLFKIA